MFFKTEQLSKKFGGVLAVNRVDLEIKEGEIVALIGPNGAGKTTFFNLITKLLEPNRGKVFFQGKDITGLPAHDICKRGIARTFQRVNIFPQLTVFECVQTALLSQEGKTMKMFTSAKNMLEDETNEILQSVGLIDQANILGDELSHGDKKALDLAITLGNQPKLILLDEPTAGMAPEETSTAMQLVKELARSHGLTVLFTEHDMSVVFGIAERIAVLHQGRLICDGSPNQVRINQEVQRVYLGEGDETS